MRQTDEAFGEFVIAAGGTEPRIADQVIHRRDAGRIERVEPCDLHRRRARGEHAGAIAHGAAHEIDEDIDAVVFEAFDQAFVAEMTHIVLRRAPSFTDRRDAVDAADGVELVLRCRARLRAMP